MTSTGAALGGLLTNEAALAAPAGLAASIASTATAMSAAGGPTFGGFIAFMSTSKIPTMAAVLAPLTTVSAVFYEWHAHEAAEAELARQRAELHRISAKVDEQASRAKKGQRRTADLQGKIKASRQHASARAAQLESAKSAVSDPEETGRAFLSAHPEAWQVLDEMRRNFFEETYGAPLRAMGLGAAEREALAREATQAARWIFRLEPRGWGVGFAPAADGSPGVEAVERRLRELLGSERAARFDEVRALEPILALVRTAAGASYDVDGSLAPAQVDAVVDATMRHGGYRSHIVGGPRDGRPMTIMNSVNWSAVLADLRGTLTAAQLMALDAAQASAKASRLEREFARGSLAPPSPKGGGQ